MTEKPINPDFLSLCGSRLYGVANPDSDTERRGFYLAPFAEWTGLPGYNFQQSEKRDSVNDVVIWNLRDFISHLIKGSTQTIEVLFSNEYIATEIGEEVLRVREWFITKHIYRSIRGFALGEISKITATEIKAKPDYVDDWTKINNFCSGFKLRGTERDEIVRMIEYIKNDTLTTRVPHNKCQDNRRKLFEKYGFDTKAAYHSVRLLSQGIELLTAGRLTFPRPEAPLLIQIRKGEKTLDEVMIILAALGIELDRAYAASTLPERPDVNKINQWYADLIKKNIARL